ncbi:glycosyltransferase family 4 protein [Dietzia sp. SYD-A1]|uniref:glycosyltransferase family 4 protein n=1 Tax=Dietzia sp. SYD-A1 TaxID=2780141 RepID=UPI0018919469|nr:glycosyltransferase family 4 protein [Dietzia sp. SYD-A1]
MRVGVLSHWFDPEGGAAAGPGTISRAIHQRGHEVDVLTGYPIYPEGKVFEGYSIRPYQKETIRGVTVHRVPIYPSHDDNAARRMANYLSYAGASSIAAPAILRNSDVALVYSSPATAATAAVPLKLLRGIPFVVQIQDLWPDTVTSSGFVADSTGSVMDRVLNYYCDAVYRHAAHIAVISPGMANLLIDRGVPADKVSVLPNWAEESSFYPTAKDPALATAFGIDRDFTVMYAGNHGEMQNLDIVIEAAAQLRSRGDIGFALVGAGVRKDALRFRAAELRLDNIAFIDPQPFGKMAQILALGDAQLVSLKDVPLYRVTMPSKIQANMAAGRPIIAAVAGDAAEVVVESDCGVTARPGDVEDLVRATLSLANASADRRADLSRNARAAYLRRFSEQSVGDSLVALLEAHRRPRRSK